MFTAMQEEGFSSEYLQLEVKRLRQEVEDLKREKRDLEILLETTTEHSDTVEAELHNRALQAARESERRLAQILEALPVGISVLDATTGQLYFLNQIAKQLLGTERLADATTNNLGEVYQVYLAGTHQLYPSERMPLIRALSGESSTIDDMEIHQGEKIIPIEVWGTPIFNEQGNIVYAIAAFQDITQRKQAEAERIRFTQELEANNIALQQMDKLKDEFLANTSHELRTPLNGIIGLAESLIDGATGTLPASTIANLEMIISSGRRLTTLINDILDFAQLKHKNIELQRVPVGMREITNLVLNLSKTLIGNKPLQLVNKIPFDIDPVHADENRLQQILYNLIGNAIKFTDSGVIEVSAQMVASPSKSRANQNLLTNNNQFLAITVLDTGIGIDPNKIERIFESFEQADGSTTREYGGTGLGLAVTKKLVQLHGGEIWVESTLGQGSTFTFTLPLAVGATATTQRQPDSLKAQAQEDEVNAIVEDALETVSLKLHSPNFDLKARKNAFKILVVDDEPVNLQVLVNHLSLENYFVAKASNGLEALAAINNGFKPDLVLLDVMMPRMTGYEVCRKIREEFSANELPVVLLTAKNQVSDMVEGFNAGANDYLTKPVLKNELLARIKTHIQLSKITLAYGRFVPHEFLQLLKRESIIDVQLGDQVQKEMTIMFCDIRSFTTLSENMTPKQNFNFINSYLKRVGPVIRNYNGFIDKYIGDAVMALFPETAEDALNAAIEMQRQVAIYNTHRQKSGYPSISIGIGLHTGILMLGTVGEAQRMETTVISDAVNLAARLEGLTKLYGANIIVSEPTMRLIHDSGKYGDRFLGRVRVKGKKEAVSIFEVYDGDSPQVSELKRQSRDIFEWGLELYYHQRFAQALTVFQEVLEQNEQDMAAHLYFRRCEQLLKYGLPETWEGIESFEEK
jgi:PAS domain S-box-containing protein